MQHSTPKNKNKIKNSRFIFRKALRKRKEKKRSSQIESKNLFFFFNTAEERKWSFSPPLSLHPFRLLSSTHTHGNKTFVTNEIRVSPSFSLFFLFFFSGEKLSLSLSPVLCRNNNGGGHLYLAGRSLFLVFNLNEIKDEATNNIQTTITYLPTTSFLPFWKKKEEINIDGYIVRRDLLVSRESSSSGVSLSTGARRTKTVCTTRHTHNVKASKGMIKRREKGKNERGSWNQVSKRNWIATTLNPAGMDPCRQLSP